MTIEDTSRTFARMLAMLLTPAQLEALAQQGQQSPSERELEDMASALLDQAARAEGAIVREWGIHDAQRQRVVRRREWSLEYSREIVRRHLDDG